MASPTLIDVAQRTAMAEKKPRKKNWIKGAIQHPGALKEKAKAAGETTKQFAAAHADDKGKTGQQARLAETLMGMRRKKLYDKSK